ncbi:MAG: type IV secretion system DNA-binding domain-containing protein [Defluviitaleaceae bacterium]|nr:type IV secretion system DNA-binding domain-containing protein [Defluviitaleaceae bacterium]
MLKALLMYGAVSIGVPAILTAICNESDVSKVKPAVNRESKVKLMSPAKASGIIFGKHESLLACSPENEEGHIAIFGGTGLGKTLAILVPTLRKWRGTAFVIDLAGDISKNVDMPNKIIFEPENPESMPYNIFAEIDETEDKNEQNELLATLAHLLMPDVRKDNSTSVFFKTEGRKMLTAALIAFYHAGDDFIDICRIIVGSDWETLLVGIKAQKNDKANDFISSFEGAKAENTAGCKQALDKAIKLFDFSEKLKRNIRRPKAGEQYFSPDKLEEHNVFVILKDDKLSVYAPLLHIVTAQSLNYMSKRQNYTGKTILFSLDEFATYGRIDLADALRKLRKKRVRIMVLTQSMADMDLIYGWDERKVMMDNFAFTVILGSDDPNTQELFSKKIGERTVIKTRISTTKKPIKKVVESPWAPGHTFTSHRTEVTTTEHEYEHVERIIPPAELGRFGDDLILLSRDGHMRLKKNFPPRSNIL